jgi:hypothetical protein
VNTYFEPVVGQYLRADRSLFINWQFQLQLKPGEPAKGEYWYVDFLAMSLRHEIAYLCEVNITKNPLSLVNKLVTLRPHWGDIKLSLQRDAYLPPHWTWRPWLFVRAEVEEQLKFRLNQLQLPTQPHITTLEATLPWNYCDWDRQDTPL